MGLAQASLSQVRMFPHGSYDPRKKGRPVDRTSSSCWQFGATREWWSTATWSQNTWCRIPSLTTLWRPAATRYVTNISRPIVPTRPLLREILENPDRLERFCLFYVYLKHGFYDFPYLGNNNPNWLIFFRGVETTNQFYVYLKLCENV